MVADAQIFDGKKRFGLEMEMGRERFSGAGGGKRFGWEGLLSRPEE